MLDELRQKGLPIALKAMTEDLQPLTCLQVSKKGVSRRSLSHELFFRRSTKWFTDQVGILKAR